jgi:hypothetical protein
LRSTEPKPAAKVALRFSVELAVVCALVAAWLMWRKHRELAAAVVGSVGVTLVLAALIAPRAVVAFRGGWMRVGGAIGRINARIVLTLLYVTVFTPIAAIRRLGGGRWRYRPGAKASYFEKREPERKDHHDQPF